MRLPRVIQRGRSESDVKRHVGIARGKIKQLRAVLLVLKKDARRGKHFHWRYALDHEIADAITRTRQRGRTFGNRFSRRA